MTDLPTAHIDRWQGIAEREQQRAAVAESHLKRATEALKQMLDEDELDYAPHCLAIARACLAEIRGEQNE